MTYFPGMGPSPMEDARAAVQADARAVIELRFQAHKKWIDAADYETLLRKWRFAPAGDPIFTGEIGAYYAKVMAEKRNADSGGAVAASKRIGWDP